jgi:peptidyl-prolyl cis-trans isomerase B (cyclophilin B)
MSIDLENADLGRVQALLDTDKGEMRFEFFPDKAPATVRNFCKLVQDGFYDGLCFHRVLRGWVVQGGCPEGTGNGGPGYQIDAEFNDTEHRRGVLSMARAFNDPNSAGSQFFIVHTEHAQELDGQQTAFGQLIDGEEVLDAIADVECQYSPTGELSVPKEPVHIKSIRLVESHGADAATEAENQEESQQGQEGERHD